MGWYRNWRTGTKLISAFLVMALLIGAIGLYGLINLANINNNARVMYEDVMTGINELQDVQQEYLNIRIIIRDYITATSNAEREDTLIRLEQTKERLDQKVQTYKLRDLPEAVDREFSEFDAAWVTYQETLQETVSLADAGRDEELEILFDGSMRLLAEKIDGIIASTVSAAMQFAAETNQANAQAFYTSRLVTIIVIVFGVALSIGLGVLISRLISKPLGRVVELVSKVSKGDLRETIDIQSKDEVGQLAEAVNRMVDGLRDTINNILMSAQSVSAASEQISASTEEIASGSSNQANAAQTINELFKELSEAIQSVAENTEQASELSEQTVEIAGRGNAVVQASMKSMTTVSEQMSKLNSESERIGDIIQVIEDIADQTNLLALNAAIEAARAGEQGRGFAVVADEVRKLAERSGEATKQITTIIKGMQENMHHSVNAVQESVELSNQTGESFQEITSILDVSGEKIAEIASASEEQAAQAHNVLQSVESISAVTEETAASSQETASTAQSLAKLADDLQTSVAVFKLR